MNATAEATEIMTEDHYDETVRWVEAMERMPRHELAMVAFETRSLPEAHPKRIAFYMVTGNTINTAMNTIAASN